MLMFYDYNYCTSFFVPLVRNTLISKGTAMADLLGFHLTDVSPYLIAGILDMTEISIFHIMI